MRWFGKTIEQQQTEDDRWTQTRQRATPDADHVPDAQYTPFKYHSFVYDTHPTHSMHPTSFTTDRPPQPATTCDDVRHAADAALCWPSPRATYRSPGPHLTDAHPPNSRATYRSPGYHPRTSGPFTTCCCPPPDTPRTSPCLGHGPLLRSVTLTPILLT